MNQRLVLEFLFERLRSQMSAQIESACDLITFGECFWEIRDPVSTIVYQCGDIVIEELSDGYQ